MDNCCSNFFIPIDSSITPFSFSSDSNKALTTSHLNILENSDVCRGVVRFPDGSRASAWFSTANLGIKKHVISDIGLFDTKFDGHYGHEDQDLGNRLKETKYKVTMGDDNTIANHGVEIYANGDRSDNIIGHNTKYFIEKWGYDPR